MPALLNTRSTRRSGAVLRSRYAGSGVWQRVSRPVALALAVLGLWLGLAGSASAHAELEGTSPAPNEILPEQPQLVEIRFNEPVSPVERQFRLFDSQQDLTTLEARQSGDSVLADLPADLPQGSYVLAWRVVSADGHPISGALPFAIGSPSAGEIAVSFAEADPLVERGLGIVQAVQYGALLALVGLVLFSTCIDRSAGPDRRLLVGLGIAGLGAMLLAIPLTVARQQVRSPGSVFDVGQWPGDVLSDNWIALAVATGGVVLLMAGASAASHMRIWLVVSGSLVALGSLSVVGHTRIVHPTVVIVLSNVTHVVAGAIWLGGLLGLVLAFRAAREAGERTRLPALVARFSGVAAIALGTVLVSGTVSSALILRSFVALTGTSYGQLLLVKVAVVLVVCALGAWNRYRLVPKVTGADDDMAMMSRLRRIVGAELLLLLLVASLTGFLVNLSPRVAATEPEEHTGHEIHPTLSFAAEAGNATATGEFIHSVDRRYMLQLVMLDETGAVVTPQEPPSVSLSFESLDVGPLPVNLMVNPDGSLFSAIVEFPFPGEWTVTFTVRYSTFESGTGIARVIIPE